MKPRSKAFRITLPALFAALSVICLALSSVIPSGRWGMVAAAGLLPAAAVISVGLSGGFAVWAVTSALGFLLVPDRLNCLLYLLLFGLYPMVKHLLETKAGKWAALLGKLCFFNAVAALLLTLFSQLFLPALPWDVRRHLYLVFLLGSLVFLVYDYGISKLLAFYARRLQQAAGQQTTDDVR